MGRKTFKRNYVKEKLCHFIGTKAVGNCTPPLAVGTAKLYRKCVGTKSCENLSPKFSYYR